MARAFAKSVLDEDAVKVDDVHRHVAAMEEAV